MITNLDAIRAVDIRDVVGKFLPLKKNSAPCPFHNEKTPSFQVVPKLNIFKCFGCGEGGDVIRFVEKYKGLDFVQAIELVAEIGNISVEIDESQREEYNKKKELTKSLRETLEWAISAYKNQLVNNQAAKLYISTYRGINDEMIAKFGLGFAPSEWYFLSNQIIGKQSPAPAVSIGLIKEKDNGKHIDRFRNRIIFPFYNEFGELIGLNGRTIDKVTQTNPKALKGNNTDLFKAEGFVYGLYQAMPAIKKKKQVALVEGELDVIQMHQAGVDNTAGIGRSILSEEQVRNLMKAEIKNVLLIPDNDEAKDGKKPGIEGAIKNIRLLAAFGLKIEIFIIPDRQDGQKQDPDDFAKAFVQPGEGSLSGYIDDNKQDAIIWLCAKWMGEIGDDPHDRAKAIDQISVLLSCIKNPPLQTAYAEKIAKEFKIKPRELKECIAQEEKSKKVVNIRIEEDDEDIFSWLPGWAREQKDIEEQLLRFGFVERIDKHNTGLYFMKSMALEQKTNFVIKPLYHIYGADNRRMLSVNNGYMEAVVEMPSKNLLSPDAFMASLFDQGNFQQMEGFSKYHLTKMNLKHGDMYPMVYELNNLGWQNQENFFAFANLTYRPPVNDGEKGVISEYNEFGVVKVDDLLFLSPAKSRAMERIRSTENPYENDLYLSFHESRINFTRWAELMVEVYGQHGWMAIPWAVATLFRDIVINVTKIPHLYAYGPVGAGKSEFGESVNNLFFSGKNSQNELYKPMNLNQGTDFSFWNRMERFYNCPNALNEFDEWAIDDEWFRAIKSAYDGEGRTKGMKDRNRSTTQKVNCTQILMGQYLGTRDDNSVLTRSIPLAFKVIPASDRPEQQVKAFNELKKLEHEGINGILLEIMDLRPAFKRNFVSAFTSKQKLLIEELKAEGVNSPTRILKNVACMIAAAEIVCLKYKNLPFTIDQFYDYAKTFVRNMTNLVSSTSGISEFWSIVEFLFDQGHIKEGYDFEISSEPAVTVTNEDKISEKRVFTPAKMILFLRLEGVHKLYTQENAKVRKAALNESTLKLYMKEQKWYVGWIKTKRFKGRGPTSCFAFDYDELNINLIKETEERERQEVQIIGEVIYDVMPVPGLDRWKTTVKVYMTENMADGTTKTYSTNYTCIFSDPDTAGKVSKGYKIRLTGMLQVSGFAGKESKTIDVAVFEAIPSYRDFEGIEQPGQQKDLPF